VKQKKQATGTEGKDIIPAAPLELSAVDKPLLKIARDCVNAAINLGMTYLELVGDIRKRSIDPVTVTATLKEAGFADSRISEVKRVAFASEEVYKEIAAAQLGFKAAVTAARLAEHKEDIERGDFVKLLESSEQEAADEPPVTEPPDGATQHAKDVAAYKNAIEKAAMLFVKLGYKKQDKTFEGVRFVVSLSKKGSPVK